MPTVEIVLDPLENGALFLPLPSLQNVFPQTKVHVGRSHIADAFVVAAM